MQGQVVLRGSLGDAVAGDIRLNKKARSDNGALIGTAKVMEVTSFQIGSNDAADQVRSLSIIPSIILLTRVSDGLIFGLYIDGVIKYAYSGNFCIKSVSGYDVTFHVGSGSTANCKIWYE